MFNLLHSWCSYQLGYYGNDNEKGILLFIYLFTYLFIWLYPWHTEVPGPGIESELQL